MLHVLVDLAQGIPVGGNGEPVGVRDPYARSAGRVLGQGVYASRRLTTEPPKCGSVLKKQTPGVLAAGLEGSWPQALRAMRAWLEPWVMLWRYR